MRGGLAAAALVAASACSDHGEAPEGGLRQRDGGSDAQGSGAACEEGGPPTRAGDPLGELRASTIPLLAPLRFHTDPGDEGKAAGWADPAFDDRAWATLLAGKAWEDQGIAYDGVAWYRIAVSIPASFAGSPVKLVSTGVDDEYDVFVNGQAMGHHGGAGQSVYNRTTETRIERALRPGETNVLALRVVDWGGGGGLTRHLDVKRVVPLGAARALLPEPVLDDHPEWLALYDEAWRMAWEKLAFGNATNGLEPAYMDEGFNEQIYQWDSSFITVFGRLGRRVFPVMATLDNFYARQRPDGYIQRVYSETDGKELGQPTDAEAMVNPPLFAWVENEWSKSTGDAARLPRVYPILTRYFRWLEDHLRAPEGRGLYWQTDLGSGMDNTPRGDVSHAAWVDMSAQQALAARSLARIASRLGLSTDAAAWEAKRREIGEKIDALLWSEADGFYYDLRRDGSQARVKHVGAFWTLLSGVADAKRAARLVEHLRDPAEFARPHPFPSLAASEPGYVRAGNYWRGGVWAPTNYAIIRGLEAIGETTLARESAEKHLAAMARVMAAPPADEAKIAPDERDGAYRSIWECYSPEADSPGTRWDDTYYCRQDFVGWSGLGPIALLLETIIGLRADGETGTVTWDASRLAAHGARRLPLGSDDVDLVADARASADAPLTVRARAGKAFTLVVRRPGRRDATVRVCAGASTLVVP